MLSILPLRDDLGLHLFPPLVTHTLVSFTILNVCGCCCKKFLRDFTEQPYFVRTSWGSWDKWPVSFWREIPWFDSTRSFKNLTMTSLGLYLGFDVIFRSFVFLRRKQYSFCYILYLYDQGCFKHFLKQLFQVRTLLVMRQGHRHKSYIPYANLLTRLKAILRPECRLGYVLEHTQTKPQHFKPLNFAPEILTSIYSSELDSLQMLVK